MHRIDGAGHVNNLFVAEDADMNRPPTEFVPDWFNAVQEELVNVVINDGTLLDKADNTQLLNSVLRLVKNVVGFQIFRVSGVFVVPQNVHDVFVTLVGGGGGGAGSINGAPYSGGGGGGGGVIYRERVAVTGEQYSVQIGTGGSGGYGSLGGGTYANSNGTAGGITSFGSLLSVSGGGGGHCQSLEAHGGSPGSAEFSSVGGSGDVSGESGGAGGGCLYAPSLSAGHSGVTGVLFGGGGSGGRGSIYSENGGNGGQGLCIIEWG